MFLPVSAAIAASADLAVVKTDGSSTANSGSSITYTVTVTNNGPDASTATLRDAIAAGLNKTAITCGSAPGVCATPPTIASLQAGFSTPVIPVGGTYQLDITTTVTATSGDVTNTATVAIPSGSTDLVGGNNSSSDVDAVKLVTDLAVVKTNNQTTVNAGANTVYTVTVTNNGPNAAIATLTDPAVSGLNIAKLTCGATPGVCVTPPTVANLQAGFATPSIPSGGTYQLSVTATVTANSGTVANTATVAVPSNMVDLTSANNTQTDTDTVIPTSSGSMGTGTSCPSSVPLTFANFTSGSLLMTGELRAGSVKVADVTLTVPGTAGNALSVVRDSGGRLSFQSFSGPPSPTNLANGFYSMTIAPVAGAWINPGSLFFWGKSRDATNGFVGYNNFQYFSVNGSSQLASVVVTQDTTNQDYLPTLNVGDSLVFGTQYSATLTQKTFANMPAFILQTHLNALAPGETFQFDFQKHDALPDANTLASENHDLVLALEGCPPGVDRSDAPISGTSPNGSGTNAYGEASHTIDAGVRLGVELDADSASLASVNAGADNTTGVNDEDGITLPTFIQGETATITATVMGAGGYLQGWVDWNGDGDFNDAGEQVATNLQDNLAGDTDNTAGMIKFMVNVPVAAVTTAPTFARFRWSTTPGLDTTTVASNGEVEDYTLTVGKRGFSLSGKVYHDIDVNGSDNTEAGLGQVTVVLHDSSSNTCRSIQTAADGSYTFSGVLAGDYSVYEAAAELRPEPNTCPPVMADPNGYESSTANSRTVTVSTANLSGIDFGDVKRPNFTLEHSQVILPGSSVTYPHRFSAFTNGSVSLSTAAQTDPASLNWDTVLYRDTNCDAELDGGDTQLNSAVLMSAGDTLCLLAKVLSPSNASSAASHTLEITSSFIFGDGSLLTTPVTQMRIDLTRISAGDPLVGGTGNLKLSKAVRNMTRNINGDVALPGETLRYIIGYENIGNGQLDEVDIQDRVPEFTTLYGLPQCGTTPPELTLCSPVVSGTALDWSFTGKLLPGSQGEVFYEVVVE
ncbi:GEVED domain-containing protein [Thiothrix eikelboomii]|uniref:GEVED domain-containing protein n=1 Tax=Thiothrix eikelboomii TaxID=92487 RepID=UPI003BAF0CC8